MGALALAGLALLLVGLVGTFHAGSVDRYSWPSRDPFPRAGNVASGIGVAGVALIIAALVIVAAGYR